MEELDCNTSLGLGIGGGDPISSHGPTHERKPPPMQLHMLFPPEEKEGGGEEPGKEQFGYRSISKRVKEEEEVRNGSNDRGGRRKKLRLSKEQSDSLEDSFREHNTLHPARKLQLAKMLGLRPRQVEVWFQNRRARTKLKQTEVNCEVLKKSYESLSDENQRLKRELQELRLMKDWSPSGIQFSKSAVVFYVCPSCKQILSGNRGKSTGPFLEA